MTLEAKDFRGAVVKAKAFVRRNREVKRVDPPVALNRFPRIVDPLESHANAKAFWDEYDAEVKAQKDADNARERAKLTKIFPNQKLRDVGVEVRAVIATVLCVSEQLAVSHIREELAEEDGQEPTEAKRVLESTEVPIRIYTATSFKGEEMIGDTDKAAKYNRAVIAIAANSDNVDHRNAVMGIIHTRLAQQTNNAYVFLNEPLPEASGTTSDLNTALPSVDNTTQCLSAFVIKGKAGLPSLQVYLGLMPSSELDMPNAVYGSNLRCIAEIQQNSLLGENSFESQNGDGDF